MKVQFLWDREKTLKLFNSHLILFMAGAGLGSVYSIFLPQTTPYYFVIVSIPILFFFSCFFYLWLTNKVNPWWGFLVFCLQGQLAASVFMALTGGFLGIIQFAPYAFLLFAVFELGIQATLILGVFSIITFIGILLWSLAHNPQPSIYLQFLYYVGSYILILVLQRNVGLELSLQLEAKKRLEEVDDLKNQFIALTSHYLRTPLTHIKSYLNELEKDKLNDQQQKEVQGVLEGTDQLETVINKLLEISTLERGTVKITLVSMNIDSLIREVITKFLPSAQAKHITLSYTPPEQIPEIFCDPPKLKQAISSLVDNAIKFNHDNGSVLIVLEIHDRVTISIIDSGFGIPKEKIDTLLSPFNKTGMKNVLTFQQPGMGLSLYLAKQIIDAHKGTLTVVSSEGKGSTFTIVLPFHRT